MAGRRSRTESSLAVLNDEPLIGVFLEEAGQEVVRYFANADETDQAIAGDARREALALAGAWRDLDWETMERELDRIRHESSPSAPLSF